MLDVEDGVAVAVVRSRDRAVVRQRDETLGPRSTKVNTVAAG